MYEILANPENYQIGALKEGLGYKKIRFPDQERKAWAEEIGTFTEKLDGFARISYMVTPFSRNKQLNLISLLSTP
ncbi:MAG: hypothetical protein JRF22_06950 [Deltaproteobacteria bacterium]|nr:hypothetical protein [Deltaproteobacteria bacterium]